MNKYIKKLLASLLAIVSLVGIFTSNNAVNAAENGMPDSVTISSNKDVQYIYGNMPGGHITAMIKKAGNGYVYCIEANKETLGKETLYFDGELTDPGYLYLAKNGFPSKTILQDYSADENYYITQVAHWMYSYVVYGKGNGKVDGYLIDSKGNQLYNFNGGGSYNKQTRLADAAYDLYKKAKAAHDKGTVDSLEVSMSGSKTLKADLENGYLISGLISVSVKGADTYTVTVDTNNAKVVDENGKVKTTFKSTEKFRVRVDSFDSVDIKITVKVTGTADKVYRYKPASSSKQAVLYTVVKPGEISKTAPGYFKYTNDNEVEISKVDATNSKELKGAHLVIKDSKGKIVDEWTSTGVTHKVKLAPGVYKLTEIVAPNGYILSQETIEFTVRADGSCDKVTMKNMPKPEVEVSKVDATNSEELPGAHLVIKDSEDKIVEEWISTEKTHKVRLMPGEYKLTETIAPDGYILSQETIKFTLYNDGKTTKVTMKNMPISEILVSKIDVTNGKELPGAHLVIKDSEDKVIDEWTSTEKVHKVKLLPGEYKLTETIAPDGYILSTETIKFTVKADGKTTKVTMKNAPVGETLISKVDATNSEELPGAHLVIKDSKGKIVDEWTSTENVHGVKLAPGEYTLTETIAPDGYILSTETIKFTVKNDGTATKVTMKNAPIPETLVSKVDATTSKELPGAHLEIKDKNNKLVDSWISTSEIHKVKLLPGEYTLIETIAPNGYILSTEEISFTVKADGTVTKVTMKNAPIRVTEVEFSKIDATNGKELPGAHLEIRDAAGNVVDSWISTSETHKVKLLDGVYTLSETIAPEGYELSTETITFEISEQKVIGKIIMENKPYIDVPITDLNASWIMFTLGSIITLLGSGLVVYRLKKQTI